MKRTLWLAGLAVLLAGCQGADTPPVEAIPQAVVHVEVVDKPGTSSPTKIGILIGKKPVITVGFASPDKALADFRDPTQFGLEYNDLPSKFEWPYHARAWETAHSGFGTITYEGVLVAAMYQESNTKQERVDELVETHRGLIGRDAQLVEGKHASYWFWEEDGQRLMICAYSPGHHGIQLTVAMGDDVVMHALGIGPEFEEGAEPGLHSPIAAPANGANLEGRQQTRTDSLLHP